jgi:hypothetical protein
MMEEGGISLANYQTPGLNTRGRQNNTEWSPFDDLALEYDVWFDREGGSIFLIGEGIRS